MTDQLLTRREVESRCRISKTTIYRLAQIGAFPAPVKVGIKAVRWRASEIAEWLASRERAHGDRASNPAA